MNKLLLISTVTFLMMGASLASAVAIPTSTTLVLNATNGQDVCLGQDVNFTVDSNVSSEAPICGFMTVIRNGTLLADGAFLNNGIEPDSAVITLDANSFADQSGNYTFYGQTNEPYWCTQQGTYNASYDNSSSAQTWINVINDSSCYPAPVVQNLSSCGNITSSGAWQLDSNMNLSVNGSACIYINANDVTLNCQNHLFNSSVEDGYGIYEDGVNNVTFYNCVFAPFYVNNLVVYRFDEDAYLVNTNETFMFNNTFSKTGVAIPVHVSNVSAYNFDNNYWGGGSGFSDLCSALNGHCTSAFDIFGNGSYFDYTPLSNNPSQLVQGRFGTLLTEIGNAVAGFLGGVQNPVINLVLLLGIVAGFMTIFLAMCYMWIRPLKKV